MVESNAYQGTLLDWIRLVSQDRSIPLKAFTTGTNKADEQIGLPGLAAEFDNGAWVIPTDGLDLEELESSWKAWILEMRTYPVAPLSDTVMACWFAREASRGRVRDPELYREIHKFNMEATDTIAGGIRTMLF
jgi:hypothetical protein